MSLEQKILEQKYIIDNKIGKGTFSDVFRVFSKKDNSEHAMKIFKKKFLTRNEVKSNIEISTLKLLRHHPNIVKIEDVLYFSKIQICAIVFELLPQNLYQFSHTRISEKKYNFYHISNIKSCKCDS